MARTLDDVMATLPQARRHRVEARTMELATLKDLRQAVQQTLEQLAASVGVDMAPDRKPAGAKRRARATA